MIAFDIDGVLADVRHRLPLLNVRPKRWQEFFEAAEFDEPLREGLAVVSTLAQHSAIVYVTGRPESNRALTRDWLQRHGFPGAALHMRRAGDRRPGAQMKSELLALLGGPRVVSSVYDDDVDVVTRLRADGYHVEHVTWMPLAVAEQGTLFDAQENLGLT